MLLYILQRLFLLIPTLLLVSIITFWLSITQSYDSITKKLQLQGINSDADNYNELFDHLYKKNKLNLPVFYFGIKPNYVNEDIYQISKHSEKKFVNRIIQEKYNCKVALNLLEEIRKLPDNTYHRYLHWSIQELKNNQNTPKTILDIISTGQSQKWNRHYPVFEWNGTNNQYHHWISKMFAADLGVSTIDGEKVSKKIFPALRWTMVIVIMNLLITTMIAFPYGLYTGLRPESTFYHVSSTTLFIIFALPSFWLATLAITFFTTEDYGMNFFPGIGFWYQGNQTFWEMIQHKWTYLLLPISIIALKDIAYLGVLIRDSVIIETHRPHIITALSKGVNRFSLAVNHILPNALVPSITLLVGAIPSAMGGSLLMEVIFNIPGMGRLIYDSVLASDWNTVFPIILISAFITSIFYLLGDIIIFRLNPKISYSGNQ